LFVYLDLILRTWHPHLQVPHWAETDGTKSQIETKPTI
jgi:hypothetical protein